MGLYDFLSDCKCVLPMERYDFKKVRSLLSFKPVIIFQPIVYTELFPLYAIEHQLTGLIAPVDSEHVYVMPVLASMKSVIRQMLEEFYFYDKLPDISNMRSYNFQFEQVILLNHRDFSGGISYANIGVINVAYIELSMDASRRIHLLLCLETPENTWKYMADRYSVDIDILVESGKGFGNRFVESSTYKNMCAYEKTEFLPKFFFRGRYSDHIPDDFVFMHCETVDGNEVEIYLTPWGAIDETASAVAADVIALNEKRKNKFERLTASVDEYMSISEGQPPIEDIRWLVKYWKQKISTDGGVSDFSQFERHSVYFTHAYLLYGNHVPTDQLLNRAMLFYMLAIRYLFDNERQEECYQDLAQLVEYHIRRVELRRKHPRAFLFCNAEDDLKLFAKSVYQYVKQLTKYSRFSDFMGNKSNSLFAEALLDWAYKNKDKEFVDWIVGNWHSCRE